MKMVFKTDYLFVFLILTFGITAKKSFETLENLNASIFAMLAKIEFKNLQGTAPLFYMHYAQVDGILYSNLFSTGIGPLLLNSTLQPSETVGPIKFLSEFSFVPPLPHMAVVDDHLKALLNFIGYEKDPILYAIYLDGLLTTCTFWIGDWPNNLQYYKRLISNFTEIIQLGILYQINGQNDATFLPISQDCENTKNVNCKEQDTSLPIRAIILSVMTPLSLLVLTAILTVLFFQKRPVHAMHETDAFFDGTIDEGTSLELKDNSNNLVMRLKYDSKKYEIPKQEFRFDTSSKTVLGRGNYGIVHKLIVFRFSDEVAVKIPRAGCTQQHFRSLLSEIKIMSFVGDHEHVIKFLGAYTKEIMDRIVYIVTELCPMGSLQSHLQQMATAGNRSVYELIRFCLEIAVGMQYISSKCVIHGDLSARNVLLDSKARCKICDFGLSRKLYHYEVLVKEKQEELPWRWLAIESLKRLEFSIKSDIWSFGITMWEIFSFGDLPYPGMLYDLDFVKKLEDGVRMTKPTHVSSEIYKKMEHCWMTKPSLRPDFDELILFFQAMKRNEYAQIL